MENELLLVFSKVYYDVLSVITSSGKNVTNPRASLHLSRDMTKPTK